MSSVTAREAGIAQRVRAAARNLDLRPEDLDFHAVVTPRRDKQGRQYVSDVDETVRYYIGSGDCIPTPETTEWMAIQERRDTHPFPTWVPAREQHD